MIKTITNIKIYYLFWLIFLSFVLRLIAVYFYSDTNLQSQNVNEWNILLENLIKYKSYSLYTYNGTPIPSVYMPPVYPFFLYTIQFVTSFEGSNLLNTIIFIQIILSTYSIFLFYQINLHFFSKKISLISSSIFSVIPLNLYACGQISSINLQIALSLLFLKFLFSSTDKEKIIDIIFLSIISAILILTRGEFILIFFIIIFFGLICKKIKIKNFTLIILVVLLVVSPYATRNYIHFNQIFLVKSLGFNLWKGNNQLARVEGYENISNKNFDKLRSEIDRLEKNKYYEISRDDVFLEEAKKNLNEDISKYIKLFFKKIFSFYFIDFNSTYPKYYNFLNILPSIFFAIFSLPGIFLFLKKKNIKHNYILLYLFLNLAIFSIFFILPRYKLIILPIQIIISTQFILDFIKKIAGDDKKFNIE